MTKFSNYILDVLTLSIFSCFDFEHKKLDSSEDPPLSTSSLYWIGELSLIRNDILMGGTVTL
jgi:hypothetical protein